MSECKTAATPMGLGARFSSSSSEGSPPQKANRNIPYQSAIGSLMYIYQATRSDLAYSISTLSKFNTSYEEHHWTAVKRVMKYLKGTMNFALTFSKSSNENVIGYCDESWQPDPHDSRSVSGFIFQLQGGAISLNCKRQSTTALSSTEAEYISLTSATQEAIWLRNFCVELEIMKKIPTIIYCDNMGALELAKNAHFTKRTRHI